MSLMNRLHNSTNKHQGKTKKVLCVCSAGLLRSPTAAVILSGPKYNFNTRAAGISSDYALVPVDAVLVSWADEIVCMTEEQADFIITNFADYSADKDIIYLGIDDNFGYRDPKLMELIEEAYDAARSGN